MRRPLALLLLSQPGAAPPPQTPQVLGAADPSLIPADAASAFEVVVGGSGFTQLAGALLCVYNRSAFNRAGRLTSGHYPPNATATVLNDSAIRCAMPGDVVSSRGGIAILRQP